MANEILAQHVSEYFNANDLSEQGSQAKITTAQIIGLLSAAMAGGNPGTGSLIGGAGEKYNSQGHYDDDDDDSDGAMASDASGAAEELKDELDVFNDHASNGGVDLLSPIPGNGVPIVGGTGGGGSGAKGTTNAPNAPRFIADSAGNTIDLDYTKGLRETNVTVTGARGGVQYPLQGQTPNSYANLGNGHVVVYGPEGRALYDVSNSRIKVVEWNQAPNGTYFPKKGGDTKAFEGNVPQSVLDNLGLN